MRGGTGLRCLVTFIEALLCHLKEALSRSLQRPGRRIAKRFAQSLLRSFNVRLELLQQVVLSLNLLLVTFSQRGLGGVARLIKRCDRPFVLLFPKSHLRL